MSDRTLDRYAEPLKAAVRDGLLARDRAIRPPEFARIWPATSSSRQPVILLRPAFATLAAVAVLTGLSWLFLGRQAGDPAPPADAGATVELARQLSSPDYWRVPTDELLAFATPPLNAELPLPDGFHVSLEESLL